MKTLPAAAPAILALFLLAAPANAASFDCAQAATAVEHMICGDEELSKLDELLGDRYVRALKKGDDPKAVKAAQRAWLRDTRNACADAACLKLAYEARIAELTKVGWMTDEKARAICEEVRDAANDGALAERFITHRPIMVDYDGDGTVESLGYRNVGGQPANCRIDLIFDRETGASTNVGSGEANFGEKEFFLVVGDEPVIIRKNTALEWIRNETTPRLDVYWMAPTFEKDWICTLMAPSGLTLDRAGAEDADLCAAVEEGAVTLVGWRFRLPRSLAAREDIVRRYERLPFVGELDLDLDGRNEVVAPMEYFDDSPSRECIDEIPRPSVVILESGPNAIATIDLGRFEIGQINHRVARVPSEQGVAYPPVLFLYRDRPYLLGRRSAELETVTSFWNGERRDWCEFRTTGRYEIR